MAIIFEAEPAEVIATLRAGHVVATALFGNVVAASTGAGFGGFHHKLLV